MFIFHHLILPINNILNQYTQDNMDNNEVKGGIPLKDDREISMLD